MGLFGRLRSPRAEIRRAGALIAQGDFEGAAGALRRAIDSGHPDVAPLAERAYRQVIESGQLPP